MSDDSSSEDTSSSGSSGSDSEYSTSSSDYSSDSSSSSDYTDSSSESSSSESDSDDMKRPAKPAVRGNKAQPKKKADDIDDILAEVGGQPSKAQLKRQQKKQQEATITEEEKARIAEEKVCIFNPNFKTSWCDNF